MKHRFRIIDADGHVIEPRGMWERYIDPAFRDRAPRVAKHPSGHVRTYVDGRPTPRVEGPNSVSLAMHRPRSRRSSASTSAPTWRPSTAPSHR